MCIRDSHHTGQHPGGGDRRGEQGEQAGAGGEDHRRDRVPAATGGEVEALRQKWTKFLKKLT